MSPRDDSELQNAIAGLTAAMENLREQTIEKLTTVDDSIKDLSIQMITTKLEITTAQCPAIEINHSGVGSCKVYQLIPTDALSADSLWFAMYMNMAALDPGTGCQIHGIVMDFSGVDLTNDPDITGLEVKLPAVYAGGAEIAGYFSGDGRTVSLCTDTRALDVTGAMFLNGIITGINSITLDTGATIDEFSTDETLAGDSDTALPTEKAVKTYADVIQTDVDGFNDELKDLAQVEIQQLENIDATTISIAQWGYLGALDQALTQASGPTFAGLTINGAMTLNGAITGVNSLACDLGTSINEFSIDGTLVGNSDDALPTEKAVKTYVDTQVATVNSLAEILALGNEADGTDLILDEGADLIVYSDDKVTEKARIDGATGNITTAGTVDGVDIDALKTDVDGFPDALKNLETTEITELEAIGATTISAAQWAYLGALDQALTQASSPTFVGLTLSGAITGVTTLSMSGQLTNTIAIGTPPFVITSTDMVANLNADLWDGYQFVDYLDQAVKQASSPTFGGLTLSGAITGVTTLDMSGNLTVGGTVDGVDVAALKTDVDGFNDELKDLTQVEIQQLELIDAVTISGAQWGYLGALDQGLTQASSPTFVGLTLSGAIATPTTITCSGNITSTAGNLSVSDNIIQTSDGISHFIKNLDVVMVTYSGEADYTSECDPSSISVYHLFADYYTGPSLRSKKTDIREVDYGYLSGLIDAFDVRRFRKIHDSEMTDGVIEGPERIGVIVDELPPELQSFDDEGKLCGYDMDNLLGVMIAKIKHLETRLGAVEAA